ncbi:MAG: hypothetical protein IJT04_07635 [Bacteroidales bacterium]|nr:hypothetical protein [Bacteroidales bacterium]
MASLNFFRAIRGSFDKLRHLIAVVYQLRAFNTLFPLVDAIPQTALHYVPFVWGY